ncbi:MAG: hypothetical protein RI897_2479 [Verrucomicrobiota bacterium]
MFLIESVEDEHFRVAVFRGVFPDLVGADADAGGCVDDDECEVADAQGIQAFTDEVEVAWGIDDIEFAFEPFAMEQGGVDGDFAVLFVLVVVGHGAPGVDGAEAIDHAAAGEHAFGEHGFAAGGVADYGEVADIAGLVSFHSLKQGLKIGCR